MSEISIDTAVEVTKAGPQTDCISRFRFQMPKNLKKMTSESGGRRGKKKARFGAGEGGRKPLGRILFGRDCSIGAQLFVFRFDIPSRNIIATEGCPLLRNFETQ
jgi:hypothetical protein